MDRYVVVYHKELEAVTKTVNEKMENGYAPLGGISVRADFMFFQAMALVPDKSKVQASLVRETERLSPLTIPITESPHANRE